MSGYLETSVVLSPCYFVSLAIQFPFIVSVQGLTGSPKFLDASLCTCHSLMTPGTLHTLTKTGASVLTSVYVKTLVDSKFSFRSCTNFQELRTPCGLYNSLCTLHPFCSSLEVINDYFDSAMGATLDMGGGLGLTQQGLSPCKMHQAYTWRSPGNRAASPPPSSLRTEQACFQADGSSITNTHIDGCT